MNFYSAPFLLNHLSDITNYKVTVNFGEKIGIKKSSAQITDLYTKEELLNKQIVGVINFPHKQIGPFVSEFLITGFIQENGSKLA